MSKLEFVATFEQKTFTNNETGESFLYYSVGVTIGDQFVKLSVPKESKQLLNYLLDHYKK